MEQRSTVLSERLQVLRRHRKLIVVATVVVTIVGVMYSIRQGTTYSAVSRVVIRPVLLGGTATAQDQFESVIDPFGLSAPIDTQAQLLLGEDVARNVRERLPSAASELVTVEGKPITDDVLEIETSSPSPRATIQMANAYAAAFIDTRQDVARNALEAAVDDLDRSLAEFESHRVNLRSNLATPPVGSDPESIREELATLADRIDDVIAQRDQLLFDLETVSGGGAIVLRARFASSSGPATIRDGVVAFVLGLMLGIGLALLRGSVDRRLHTPQEVVDATDTQILAAIPRARTLWHRRSSGVVIRSRSRQGTLEAPVKSKDDGVELRLPAVSASALAAVRASLVTRGLGSRYRTVTLLSPEPGQASAVAAGGIAWACATIGLRAIVVDAAGLDESDRVVPVAADRGLFQVLNGSAGLSDVLVPTSIPGLRLLPPGRSRDRPLDVLGEHDPKALMERLRQSADVVLIRSPAVSSGGDAVMWMSVSDIVVLVVRAGACKPIMAQRASQVARSLDVPLLGTILMDADRHDGTIDGAVLSKRLGSPRSSKLPESNGGQPSTAPDTPRSSDVASSMGDGETSGSRHDAGTARRRHR